MREETRVSPRPLGRLTKRRGPGAVRLNPFRQLCQAGRCGENPGSGPACTRVSELEAEGQVAELPSP